MLKLTFPVLFLLTMNAYSSVSYDSDIEEKKEIITRIVDSYRPEIISRYGYDVKLTFRSAQVFQLLGGHDRNGNLVIDVYAQALTKFNQISIVSAVCHELGHILGNVTNELAGNLNYNPLDSIEGEADYFGGKCTHYYFKSTGAVRASDQAIGAARHVMFTLYGGVIDETPAKSQFYQSRNGINPSYPNSSCRLWSMMSGVLELPRPTCWYNPDLLSH